MKKLKNRETEKYTYYTYIKEQWIKQGTRDKANKWKIKKQQYKNKANEVESINEQPIALPKTVTWRII